MLLPVIASVFALDALTTLVVIAYGNSYLINTLGAPAAYPAYALGIYGFVKLLTAPAGGWLLDKVRSTFVIATASVLELCGLVIILATNTAAGYLAGVGTLSTGIALAWLVVFHALGAGSDPEARGAATAYMGLTSISATAVGFGIAALVSETRYWQIAFAAGIALSIAATAAMLRVDRGPAQLLAGHVEAGLPRLQAENRRRLRIIAGTVVFAHFAVVTATLGAFGPFVLRTLDLSLLDAGLLLAPAGLAGALAMYIAGRRSKHGRRLSELALLYGLAAAAVAWMLAAHGPVLFALAAVPLAIALGGVTPLLNASLLDAARAGERSGAALGWLFFAEGLGSVVGPAAIGATISVSGVREGLAGLACAIALLAITAAVGGRLARL
jgi:MFS family permease